MPVERSNVDFPLWRKKVDKSLFEHNGTTIPTWACSMWGIQQTYGNVSSKHDDNAKVTVRLGRREFQGWVTVVKKNRVTPAYRLWYEESLTYELKQLYLMSYMRSLEAALSDVTISEIEKQIPFWEFLDIEYNGEERLFILTDYYRQTASFPHLFKRLIGSPQMSKIDDEVRGKKDNRIHKQDWKPRSELQFEMGAQNVIYMLVDNQKKHFLLICSEN